MIREFFAGIYESVIYDAAYDTIFMHLFQDWGYVYFGLIFIVIPLIFSALFYFLYFWNPYSKWWHWLIWLLVCLIFVFGITFGVANVEIFASDNDALIHALSDTGHSYYEFASLLPFLYGILNILFGLIVFLLFSWIFKQFSKLHGHIPI